MHLPVPLLIIVKKERAILSLIELTWFVCLVVDFYLWNWRILLREKSPPIDSFYVPYRRLSRFACSAKGRVSLSPWTKGIDDSSVMFIAPSNVDWNSQLGCRCWSNGSSRSNVKPDVCSSQSFSRRKTRSHAHKLFWGSLQHLSRRWLIIQNLHKCETLFLKQWNHRNLPISI